jgi:hypothetical protein
MYEIDGSISSLELKADFDVELLSIEQRVRKSQRISPIIPVTSHGRVKAYGFL